MDGINEVQVSRDGRYALSGSYDNTVRLWDIGGAASALTLGVDPQAIASGHGIQATPPGSGGPPPSSDGKGGPGAMAAPPSSPPSFRGPDSDFVGMMLTPVGGPPPSSSVVDG
ncbi:MAG: WD40 repeat domain-containing protein, partial [Chloroflexota bacterium]